MLKLGSQTGSMTNHVMSRHRIPENLEVGMGVTTLMWSDRVGGTIIKITPTQIHVQDDKVTRIDSNGMSEDQVYSYERDPNGIIRVFRKTKSGYRSNGNGLMIGRRDHYHDYSF